MTNTTALIVVDMQAGTLGGMPPEAAAAVSDRAAALLRAFRAQDLPVVLATVTGMPSGRTAYSEGARTWPADWAASAPGFEPVDSDIAVDRVSWSALADPTVIERLRERGVDTVVIVGVATSFGVESTARSAYDAGLNVVLPVDAMTDRSAEAHDLRVASVFPALGRVTDAETVLQELTAQE